MEKHKWQEDFDISNYVLNNLCLGLAIEEKRADDLREEPDDEHDGNYKSKALHEGNTDSFLYLMIFLCTYALRNIGRHRSRTVSIEQLHQAFNSSNDRKRGNSYVSEAVFYRRDNESRKVH